MLHYASHEFPIRGRIYRGCAMAPNLARFPITLECSCYWIAWHSTRAAVSIRSGHQHAQPPQLIWASNIAHAASCRAQAPSASSSWEKGEFLERFGRRRRGGLWRRDNYHLQARNEDIDHNHRSELLEAHIIIYRTEHWSPACKKSMSAMRQCTPP